jgi:hypothetical protein
MPNTPLRRLLYHEASISFNYDSRYYEIGYNYSKGLYCPNEATDPQYASFFLTFTTYDSQWTFRIGMNCEPSIGLVVVKVGIHLRAEPVM